MTDDESPDNVVVLDTITTLPIPPQRVLDNAPRDMRSVMVLGYEKDGEYWMASSDTDLASLLVIVEKARMRLLRLLDD